MNAKIGLSERPGLVLATRQGYLPCRSWPEPDGWEAVQGRLSDERSETRPGHPPSHLARQTASRDDAFIESDLGVHGRPIRAFI
jgi:hypothetical protein